MLWLGTQAVLAAARPCYNNTLDWNAGVECQCRCVGSLRAHVWKGLSSFLHHRPAQQQLRLCITRLCITWLCITRLCITWLCITWLCITRLCITRLCITGLPSSSYDCASHDCASQAYPAAATTVHHMTVHYMTVHHTTVHHRPAQQQLRLGLRLPSVPWATPGMWS